MGQRAAEMFPAQVHSVGFTAFAGSMGTGQMNPASRDPQLGTTRSELQAIDVPLGLRLKALREEMWCHLYFVAAVETAH